MDPLDPVPEKRGIGVLRPLRLRDFRLLWLGQTVSLIGDGMGMHIPKGYIYFAMGFSVFVEMINLRLRKPGTPVDLHTPYTTEPPKP